MTYNRAILGTESFKKKWSHCDGHLVESPVTVTVMILMIPRKVISYDPISFGAFWAPAVKRSLGVSPPKRDIPDVTKHHYCLCFCRQTKIILENLKIEEEPSRYSDAPTVKFCCCHRTLLSSIEKRKGLYTHPYNSY